MSSIKTILAHKELTEEETKKLLIEYKSGSKSAKNMLIEGNMRIVLSLAIQNKKFFNLELEDLISIGLLGLLKAVKNYDFNSNSKISSFIYLNVKNEFYNESKATRTKKRNFCQPIVSLQESFNEDNLLYEDIVPSNLESAQDLVEKEAISSLIEELFSKLNKQEEDVIKKIYGLTGTYYTCKSISSLYNVTPTRISQIKLKGLSKMKSSEEAKRLKLLI